MVWGGVLVLAYLVLVLQLRQSKHLLLGDPTGPGGTVRLRLATLSAGLSAFLSALGFFLAAWNEFPPPSPPCSGPEGCPATSPLAAIGLTGIEFIELLLLSVLLGVALLTLTCRLNAGLQLGPRVSSSAG